ncbi:hypothetical protein CLM62_30675 [Streptomyces sp. SA15]|nr:hypothetical protein CLM62_30675 [Streptomyces sp. SA15]
MIHRPTKHVQRALDGFQIPVPLTVETLFAAIEERYPRPLELLRGQSPLPGLSASGLWITRPDQESDAMWVDPGLDEEAAVHNLAHEGGHFFLGHQPVLLPAAPPAEPYEFVSADFLNGCLLGRTRSQEGPHDPEYVEIEDQAEAFAFLLRKKAHEHARDSRYESDPLLDRLHRSL